MATRDSKYWNRRFSTLENSLHNEGLSCYAEIEQQYRRAEHEIETKMRSWYNRFAENNEISISDARRLLKSNELEEFKWTVQDYIKAGEENALDGRWMKELENASAKYHISRLESLELELQQSLEVMFGNQLDSLDAAMRKVYTDGYYHTAFEIQKGWGVGWNFAQLDERKINKVIRKPWAADGRDFSERIWENREKLVNELNQTLVQNMALGEDPQKAINTIAQKMEVSKRNAGRLVMTEEAYFASVSQADCFRELDVEQYQIIVTFDKETCDTCGDMDGRVFKMSEREVGATAPPFHPNCRCTTIPYFDEWYGLERERAARDENGQTYQVPADTTYKEWRGNLTNGANASNAEAEALKTTTFSDAEAANAYFGQAPERSLRRTDREEYDRLTEEYKQSAYGQWQANLTGDQESAIGRYTGDDYSAINGVLRGEMTENQVQRWDASGGLTTMEKIDDITDAISKFQLKDNITVYRTCEEDVFRNLQKQIGSIFVDDGFTSTSVLDTPVASGNVKMVIDVPAGIGNGAWISPLSGSPDEYEFLLQRGTQYRIDSIQETDGDIQIHMTVVGNNPKSEIKYASKEEVIQQWKDKGIYDEESEKYL